MPLKDWSDRVGGREWMLVSRRISTGEVIARWTGPRLDIIRRLDHIAGRTLSPEEWTELYRRHDQYMVGEPPPREPT